MDGLAVGTLPNCWLFTDIFRKPSVLSTTLALAIGSFLSLSLNLNCGGDVLSQGTRSEGHCDVPGRISQVSAPYSWGLSFRVTRISFVPAVLTWTFLPSVGTLCCSPCRWHQRFLGQRERGHRAGCFSPASLPGEAGARTQHHSFIQKFGMRVIRRTRASSQTLC